MPRAFTETDRAAIRAALLDAGEASFKRFGLRKTGVEQLARAAGVAKGTFYAFFASKEELCVAIFERQEAAFREELGALLAAHDEPVDALQAVLEAAVRFVMNDSLLTALRENGELALVTRGVGRERWGGHLASDVDFVRALLDDLRKRGARADIAPEVAAGALRAAIVMGFHAHEIGGDVFPEVVARVTRWFAEGIVRGEDAP